MLFRYPLSSYEIQLKVKFYTTHRHMSPLHSPSLPVDARALDAQQHAQVDRGPARLRVAAVTALAVPGQTLDPLQDGLHPDEALPRLAGRVDAAGGRGGRPLQTLRGQRETAVQGPSHIHIQSALFVTMAPLKVENNKIEIYS